jgi:hypothetical protein
MSGEFCPASKLTWMQVLEIRKSNRTGPELAKVYNVSKVTISNIRNNKIWRDEGYVRTERI